MLSMISSGNPYVQGDMANWSSSDVNQLKRTERMDFKIFDRAESGTIKIRVMERKSPDRLIMVRAGYYTDVIRWWKELLSFWAYEWPKPGTEMISVGSLHGDTCFFVKGGNAEEMEKWGPTLSFWVPV